MKSVKRVLIANRGEIALRIIRCCREMNMETVLACSTEDKNSLPVMMATRSICIGPPQAAESYLNQDAILEAARKMHCDAIHPGYGFLSENAVFAEKCRENGIRFIGPSPDLIRKMGDKQQARSLMMEHGIPVVPGSKGCLADVQEAERLAGEIGYPVLLKAVSGGGGKGMRRIYRAEEMEHAFAAASAEAEKAFGDGRLYLEKLIENPRHIEVQILADGFGNVLQLGERDCSLQKNNQKLMEESPASVLPDILRRKLCGCAVAAARAAGYDSAGTVEFILDADGAFYFIEMNTRIQVEHPVTEAVTGIDLIREQIRVAFGRPLSLKQEDVQPAGCALECRINALSCGTVTTLHLPAGYGVRVESALYVGCRILPWYDSMIAKIIVTGKTRREAVRRLRRCLEEVIIEGVQTNLLQMYLLTWRPAFVRGGFDTSFWSKLEPELVRECRALEDGTKPAGT